MKVLAGLLLLLMLSLFPLSTSAQKSRVWIKIDPSDEPFVVRMPQQPKVQVVDSYNGFIARGRAYSTSRNGVTYTVWFLTTGSAPYYQHREIKDSLDAYADFVWESLLKPVRDALPKREQPHARMIYKSELTMRAYRGREYSLRLGDATGTTRFYLDGPRVCVLVGLGARRNSARMQTFFNGFRVKPPIRLRSLPVAATLVGDPLLIPPDTRTLSYGRKLPDDQSRTATPQGYDRIFAAKETTHPARILSKPEPQYTEAARSNQVSGTVVLRVVLSKEGRVENIRMVSGLPHGLTQAAITAAGQLKFTPATKDGHVVSQYAGLEYNFNPY
jgi:TonB family protein